jgi:hypothetical protein
LQGVRENQKSFTNFGPRPHPPKAAQSVAGRDLGQMRRPCGNGERVYVPSLQYDHRSVQMVQRGKVAIRHYGENTIDFASPFASPPDLWIIDAHREDCTLDVSKVMSDRAVVQYGGPWAVAGRQLEEVNLNEPEVFDWVASGKPLYEVEPKRIMRPDER